MSERFEVLMETMEHNFKAVIEAVSGLSDRVERMDKRLEKVEHAVNIHTGQIAALKHGQDELRKDVKGLQHGQDELCRGQDELRRGQDELRDEFRAFRLFTEQTLTDHAQRLNKLESSAD